LLDVDLQVGRGADEGEEEEEEFVSLFCLRGSTTQNEER